MARRIQALVLLSFLLISRAISDYPQDAIKSLCSQTPNPQPCEYFLANNPKYNVHVKEQTDLIKVSSQIALDGCLHAVNDINYQGPKCRNEREKAAWNDCVELYEETIDRINKTIDPECSPNDAQTWLSAALTNLETCKLGFQDFNITDYIFPLMSKNVSLLLSNALALSIATSNYEEPAGYNKKGFPSWVSPGNRMLLQSSAPQANVVVAQDGSGHFRTVSEAVSAAARSRGSGKGKYVIYVKQGTYVENVNIGKGLKNIMLLGDGIGRTIIAGSRSVAGGSTTFKSATVGVMGDGFTARGITFRNTAGPHKSQAVALQSMSDLSVFYQCSIEGYQDALYVHSNKQFYRECDIYGTVDFIFGDAAVVFQNCNIYPRNPPNGVNTITAQGRSEPSKTTGIVIQNCRVTAAPDLRPVQKSVRTYLGRPWKSYSRTVFISTFLDDLIDPAGWTPWSGQSAPATIYYAEYMNNGPGSSTENRVKWRGFYVITSPSEAAQFAPGNFIAANSWVPATDVPLDPYL